jgi:hypothetical protein
MQGLLVLIVVVGVIWLAPNLSRTPQESLSAPYKPTSTRAPADRKALTNSWLLNINELLPNVG